MHFVAMPLGCLNHPSDGRISVATQTVAPILKLAKGGLWPLLPSACAHLLF